MVLAWRHTPPSNPTSITSCDGTRPVSIARGLEVARLVCFSFRPQTASAAPPVYDECRFRDGQRQVTFRFPVLTSQASAFGASDASAMHL